MKNPQKRPIDWQGIFNYLKHTLRHKAYSQKKPIITVGIFILLFISSFFWGNDDQKSPTEPDASLQKGEFYTCQLSRIIDGDTVIAHCGDALKQRVNIRIWGIDAPEMKQEPWGNNAKKALEKIFFNNNHDTIILKIRDIDQYNRYVGQIFINNKEIDIGLQMVSDGQAVVYRQYNNNQQYQEEERHAKSAKKGIWKHKGSQQDPASWRKVNPF